MNRIELIQHQAEQVFGSKMKAAHWLNQPIAGANGSSRLQSEAGYELVKAEFERIDHGYAS